MNPWRELIQAVQRLGQWLCEKYRHLRDRIIKLFRRVVVWLQNLAFECTQSLRLRRKNAQASNNNNNTHNTYNTHNNNNNTSPRPTGPSAQQERVEKARSQPIPIPTNPLRASSSKRRSKVMEDDSPGIPRPKSKHRTPVPAPPSGSPSPSSPLLFHEHCESARSGGGSGGGRRWEEVIHEEADAFLVSPGLTVALEEEEVEDAVDARKEEAEEGKCVEDAQRHSQSLPRKNGEEGEKAESFAFPGASSGQRWKKSCLPPSAPPIQPPNPLVEKFDMLHCIFGRAAESVRNDPNDVEAALSFIEEGLNDVMQN